MMVSSAGKLFLLLSNSTLQQGEKQEKKKKKKEEQKDCRQLLKEVVYWKMEENGFEPKHICTFAEKS